MLNLMGWEIPIQQPIPPKCAIQAHTDSPNMPIFWPELLKKAIYTDQELNNAKSTEMSIWPIP